VVLLHGVRAAESVYFLRFFVLKESSPFREPLKLKMPAGSGHDETDGG